MKNEDPLIEVLEKLKPYAAKITFGSFVGYCSGSAAKKVGKLLAVLGGLAFIAIQSAAYSGYLQVDWEKVQNDAIATVDVVSDLFVVIS